MNKFLGFYKHESKEDGVDIFAAWYNAEHDEYSVYAPLGGHSGASKGYIDESIQYVKYKDVFEESPQLIVDIIHIYCND